MAEDARRTTHPIQQPIANETEAMAAFDVITYSKGQAFIRMLESYLGEEKFRAGIRHYMAEHAFSNTTTADLWSALEAASGEPVAKIAAAFTEQAGVPLIIAEASCVDGRATLSRCTKTVSRCTIPSRSRSTGACRSRWVRLRRRSAGAVPRARWHCRSASRTAAASAVKLNLGDVGYYRVQYDAATRRGLRARSPR